MRNNTRLIYWLAAGNAALCWYWTSHACECAKATDRPLLRKLIQLLWMFLGLA